MKLFLKNKTVATDKKKLPVEIQSYEEKQETLLVIIRALLYFLKDFTLDLKEIDAERFNKEIDELKTAISSEKKTKKIDSLFNKKKEIILSHIKRQNDYIKEKEVELKDIIDILTKALVEFDSENKIFNEIVYSQSEKLDEITRLEDIKIIKRKLKEEIAIIKKNVLDKQAMDKKKVEHLSIKIGSLNVELEKVTTTSMTDGLTGVYNRMGLDKFLNELVEKNLIIHFPFSLLIMDIDNFKIINDTHGHQVGDRIILALVENCKKFMRGDDIIARYGGDEFVAILPKASLKNAIKKAKYICNAIAENKYSLDNIKKKPLMFTISIGVSAYRKNDTITTVLERADKALYLTKEKGKNNVYSEKDL